MAVSRLPCDWFRRLYIYYSVRLYFILITLWYKCENRLNSSITFLQHNVHHNIQSVLYIILLIFKLILLNLSTLSTLAMKGKVICQSPCHSQRNVIKTFVSLQVAGHISQSLNPCLYHIGIFEIKVIHLIYEPLS